jgi:hypothetical protein
MPKHERDWHPVAKILYWLFASIWTVLILGFYSAPSGVIGGLAEQVFDLLTPKYVTLIMNTFSLVGAYVVTRLLLSFRIGWKSVNQEIIGVLSIIWIALTSFGLMGARCDIYIFCAEDVSIQTDCELDWDRQRAHCR